MRLAATVALLLAAWGGALLLQVPRDPPEVQHLPGGATTRLFAPGEPPPWPALVSLHSIFQDPDSAEAPVRAAARAGMAGVQVILRAGGTFEDHLDSARQVLAWLRRDPRFGKISLYGHSMGADLACTLAADDPTVAAVVAAGFPVDASPGRPARLLVVVGAWDELHPLAEMAEAADRAGAPLLVLPGADHAAETVSPDLFEAIASWCGARTGPALRPDPFVGRGLLALGLVGPFWIGMRRLGRRGPALLTVLLVALAALAPVPGLAAAVTLAALLAASLAHLDLPGLLPGITRKLGLVLAIAGIALAVNSWQCLADTPVRFLGLLGFLALAAPLAAARAGSSLAPLGTPGWIPLAWLAVELLAPGRLARTLAGVHRRLVAALRRLDLRPRLDVTPGAVLVLLGCLGAAALAWREVGQAGYLLDSAEVLSLAGLFTRLAVLPAVLLVLAVRTGLWGETEGEETSHA